MLERRDGRLEPVVLAAGQGIVEARSLAAVWVKDRHGDRPDATDLIEACARGIIIGHVSAESAVARRAPNRSVRQSVGTSRVKAI